MKNKVIIFVLSIVAVLGITVVAYAATDNVGGGVWDHGSTAGGVHSYYYHSQKTHSSTACVKADCAFDKRAKQIQSKADKGKNIWDGETQTFWATY